MLPKIDGHVKFKRKDDVPWKEIDKECIILNLENGNYHTLDDVGLFLWKLLDGNKNLQEITKSIASRYDVTPAQAHTDLVTFLKELHRLNFVEITA